MNSQTPGSVELVIHECQLPAGTDVGGLGYESCRNPLFALDHPTECGVLSVTNLFLVPPTQSIAHERSGVVEVLAQFSDGRTANVTGEAIIQSLDPHIAHYLGGGVFSGDTVGSTGVTATWQGRLVVGNLNVFDNTCVASVPWDVVFVTDDAGVYTLSQRLPLYSTRPGQSAFPAMVPALRRWRTGVDYYGAMFSLILSLDLLDSGLFIPGEGWNSVATNPIGIGGLRTGHDRIWTGAAWSDHTIPPIVTAGSSSIGAQLMAAYQIHLTGRPGVRKIVVLFTMGGDTSCTPSLSGAAAALKANGIELVIVTALGPDDVSVISPCDGLLPSYLVLQAAASPCLFFDRLNSPWAQIFRVACGECSSGIGIGLNSL